MTLSELFTNIANAIRGKDGTTATITPTDFPDRISAIETGIQLPTLTNPGAAGDLRSEKQLIGQDGSTVNGSLSEVTQATPGISVSSSGLITASVTQSGGIVTAGTKSATKQLTTQAAKTVTPGTSSQTAVASGVYTTGAVTMAGDSNLVAGNIKSGVSIFGVAGTLRDYKVIDIELDNITISKDSYGRTVFKIANSSITGSEIHIAIDWLAYVSSVGDDWYIARQRHGAVSSKNGEPTMYCYYSLFFYGGYDCAIEITIESGYVVITCSDNGSTDDNVYDMLSEDSLLNPTSWRSSAGNVVIS